MSSIKRNLLSMVVVLIIIFLLLVACHAKFTSSPPPTITITPIPSTTITPSPSPTITITPNPSTTSTPSPTPTPYQAVLKNTPLPPIQVPITAQNADQVVQLARWGMNVSMGNEIEFAPDSTTLFLGVQTEGAQLWDAYKGELIGEISREPGFDGSFRTTPTIFALSPDGMYVLIGRGDPPDVWNIPERHLITSLPVCNDRLRYAEFSPDSRYLVITTSAYYYSTCFFQVGRWDDPEVLNFLLSSGNADYISDIAFSPDSNILAAGTRVGFIDFFRTKNLDHILTLNIDGSVSKLAYTPDGTILAVGLADNSIQLWEMTNLTSYKVIDARGTINAMEFSPNSQLLATGSDDNMIRLWDTHTGELLAELRGHVRSVFSLDYSPDGRLLASYGDEGTVRLWGILPASDIIDFHATSTALAEMLETPSPTPIHWFIHTPTPIH